MVPLPFYFLDACIDLTALETLVEYRITGFPVIDDDWKLVRILTFSQLTLCSLSCCSRSWACYMMPLLGALDDIQPVIV